MHVGIGRGRKTPSTLLVSLWRNRIQICNQILELDCSKSSGSIEITSLCCLLKIRSTLGLWLSLFNFFLIWNEEEQKSQKRKTLVNWFSVFASRGFFCFLFEFKASENDDKTTFSCHLTSPRCIIILFFHFQQQSLHLCLECGAKRKSLKICWAHYAFRFTVLSDTSHRTTRDTT
jgi:hypothetical protein